MRNNATPKTLAGEQNASAEIILTIDDLVPGMTPRFVATGPLGECRFRADSATGRLLSFGGDWWPYAVDGFSFSLLNTAQEGMRAFVSAEIAELLGIAELEAIS